MAHDPPQEILQVFLGIDAEMPAGLNQRHDDRAGLAAIFASDEHPVLATDRQGANCPLGDVIVQPSVGVIQVVRKMRGQTQVERPAGDNRIVIFSIFRGVNLSLTPYITLLNC